MITWLMLQVPAMIEAAPVRVTPEPIAEATTSNRPPTTGVPAARPVCCRRLLRHLPGNIGAFDQRRQQVQCSRRARRPPSGRGHSGASATLSSPQPAMSETSLTRWPVSRLTMKSLQRKTVPILSKVSGSMTLEPGEQRRRLRRPGPLQADRIGAVANALAPAIPRQARPPAYRATGCRAAARRRDPAHRGRCHVRRSRSPRFRPAGCPPVRCRRG